MNALLKFALTEAIKHEPAILAELSAMVEEASANLVNNLENAPAAAPVAAPGEVVHFDQLTKQPIAAPVFATPAASQAPEVVAAEQSAVEASPAPAAAPVVAPAAVGTNVKIH